jgi:hypothetical protein
VWCEEESKEEGKRNVGREWKGIGCRGRGITVHKLWIHAVSEEISPDDSWGGLVWENMGWDVMGRDMVERIVRRI